VELASRLGLDSETKAWPVQEARGKVRFEKVDALILPFVREGAVVRRKFKAWKHPDGSPAYLQDKGGLRIAFNEDCLRDDSLIGSPLLITEGELDAVAAIQAGFTRTISVPDGSPQKPVDGAEDLESSTRGWPTSARCSARTG
jgi:twinkle protein